jgi:hypothetical protein
MGNRLGIVFHGFIETKPGGKSTTEALGARAGRSDAAKPERLRKGGGLGRSSVTRIWIRNTPNEKAVSARMLTVRSAC